MAKMITLDEAIELVRARSVRPRSTEQVPLADALGRRLAAEFRAATPWPSTDRSAMDGFALATAGAGAAAGARFAVVGEALAGHPFARGLERGQAVRIMTGGVVPRGADAVAKVEDTSGFAGATVVVNVAVGAGANIRPCGSEVEVGRLLLPVGRRVRAAEVGSLAALGVAEVPVFPRPRVAILSTGDEVVPIDVEPAPHQVRDSNAHALAAQVVESGGEPIRLGIVGDDVAQLRAELARGLAVADVLVTIGGVSQGSHDLVDDTLRELGVVEVFHGVALKPGKPTFFGQVGSDGPPYVFGLPGNPASAFTTFDLLVRPLLAALGGATESEVSTALSLRARIAGSPFRRNVRTQAVPARLHLGGDDELMAELTDVSSSGDPFALLEADGYALLREGAEPGSARTAPFRLYADGWRAR
jgi:molybdopterin molybdotransferase